MIRFFQPHHRAYRLPYATGEELPAGTPDAREPCALIGDPAVFSAVERTCNRYTQPHAAGVLSYEEDLPDEKARQLVEEFFDVSLPGRHVGQFLFCCLRHHEKSRRQKHRTGLHWFALNTDLILNRKLDFCWGPRDGRRLECWHEFVNLREGYASPKDANRSRAIDVRTWPESPASAAVAAQFASRLANLELGGANCREELECALLLCGVKNLVIDHTRTGRLRARFSSDTSAGQQVNIRIIAAPEKRVDPLRRSFLKELLRDTGFSRTPTVFSILREQLVQEIRHAAKRQDSQHSIDADRLRATLQSVENAQLYRPPLPRVRDETGMRFPTFQFPQEVLAWNDYQTQPRPALRGQKTVSFGEGLPPRNT